MNWWQETNKASVLEYYELKKAGSHERQVLLSICQMLGGYFCFTHPWLTSGCALLLKWSLQMPASICSRRHCPVNIYLFFFWAWQIQTNQKQIQMTIWWRDELACLVFVHPAKMFHPAIRNSALRICSTVARVDAFSSYNIFRVVQTF